MICERHVLAFPLTWRARLLPRTLVWVAAVCGREEPDAPWALFCCMLRGRLYAERKIEILADLKLAIFLPLCLKW